MLDSDITELTDIHKVLIKKNNSVSFISDYVRHQVMSYFIKNCLVTDEDYENYIKFSSVDSLLEYIRPWWYDDVYHICTKKVLFLPESLEDLFFQRLGLDVLRHVMVEWNEAIVDRIKTVREAVQKTFKLPSIVFCEKNRNKFVEYVKKISEEKQASIQSLNLNSLFGSFLIGRDDNSPEVPENLALSQSKWNILVSILMSESYSLSLSTPLEEISRKLNSAFPLLKCDSRILESDIVELTDISKVLSKENNSVRFISEDVRHQVMSYFVKNCLVTDEDYENYIKLSSVDSLLEYVRPWWYMVEDVCTDLKKYLFLPETLEDSFFQRLGLDVLRHPTINDWKCYEETTETFREKVKDNFNVPEEIFDWEYDARCRYIECAKRGTKTVHRARAMIVGCAGAGKTTLLKRLEKLGLEELLKVRSTVGLEVHEDMFELDDDSSLRALSDSTDKDDRQILSVVDFGGQCAYYACHQVYLSRRAFYLLVIDMSKSFDEKIDPALCEQEGTMFADWTYGDYILFWLKSVHTYCESNAPVVIVGTHFEKVKGQNSDTFYNKILDRLQFNKHLKKLLDRKRCFVLGFHEDGTPFNDTLSDLEKCIIEIAREEKWKENIPTDWALCEVVFRELKKRGSKMISIEELSKKCYSENEVKSAKMGDVLKFYHDIGVILYFNEGALSDTVILDIQWFIDSFKNIITDPNHVRDVAENRREWLDFYTSGHILDTLLTNIWKLRNFASDFWNRYQYKEHLLQYMERLGLIAVGTVAHYIPCMNKRTFGSAEENYFHSLEYKTPVLVFRFEFLPYFFYFRLIVSCLTRTNREWRVLQDNGRCLYKNVACFAYKQHAVALAVNPSSIQLQVFQPTNTLVTKQVVLEVRNIITDLLNDLLRNFHKKIDMYTVGFQCSKQEVFHEFDDCFVEEEELLKKGTMLCPKHELNHSHILHESVLLSYWNLDVLAELTDPDALVEKGACRNLPEPEMRTYRFQCFEKLTKIGREALQRYFDKVFPPLELIMLLQKKKKNLSRQLNKDQCDLLFPVDKSIPTSSAFDVTLMYKLLRNFGPNLPYPTKGWGKTPEPVQKSPTDDVERIRVYRNEVEHKTPATSVMEKEDCRVKWRDLCQAILRLSEGKLEQDIMELRQQG
ncbi:uncharacterized protein LOC134282979 [Saccostrea cucullata]|uniref:uncharacterized protein LOC134282979 n=1 Tax=Saccostrea cuccullata TaxID=36930 RepID=UPI002ED34FAE